jgi:predicted nucleic acid-binding protein
VQQRWRFGFYGAPIAATSMSDGVGCRQLLNQGLRHGQGVEGLTGVDTPRA